MKSGYSFTIGSFQSTALNQVASNQVSYFIDSETGLMVFYGNGEYEEYICWDSCYSWYSSGSKIKHVIFEKGVTKIDTSSIDNRNENYPNIKNVRIGNSVTIIGEKAFQYCSSVTSITIGNSVTTIGNSAFCLCTSLTSVTMPTRITTIGDSAFNSCSSLITVTIPSGVTSIGESAFRSCSSLTSITIPSSVTSIGDFSFSQCTSLTNVVFEGTKNPTTCYSDSFYNCPSTMSVSFPNGYCSTTFCEKEVTPTKC